MLERRVQNCHLDEMSIRLWHNQNKVWHERAETRVHKLMEVALVIVTGCLFVLLMRIRPDAKPFTRKKVVGLFIVGVIIGLIFVSTHGIYNPASAL